MLQAGSWLRSIGLVQRLEATGAVSAFIEWTLAVSALWARCDDSTIKSIIVIIIIIIIIITVREICRRFLQQTRGFSVSANRTLLSFHLLKYQCCCHANSKSTCMTQRPPCCTVFDRRVNCISLRNSEVILAIGGPSATYLHNVTSSISQSHRWQLTAMGQWYYTELLVNVFSL